MLKNYCVIFLIKKLTILLKIRIEAKKIYRVLELNESQWLKKYVELNTQKRIEAEKNGHKNGKTLQKLMNNGVYGKTMENVRNRIDVKLVSNKNYLKWKSKRSYVIQIL